MSQSPQRFSYYKNSDNVALILLRLLFLQKLWCSFSLDPKGLCLVGDKNLEY